MIIGKGERDEKLKIKRIRKKRRKGILRKNKENE